MTNVTPFGKKPKTPPPPPPTHGDMTGYAIARAISKHFGISITNEDAIKLDHELRAMVFHSMQQARAEELERICKAIKEEDDYCVDEGNYMLDSDDCIAVARGEWERPDYGN